MLYLAYNQISYNNVLQNFIIFVGDSKLISYNDEFKQFEYIFEKNIDLVFKYLEIPKDFFNYARKKGININSKSSHGGLIDCTILARILYDKYLDKNIMIKMTGVYIKPKNYNKEKKDY